MAQPGLLPPHREPSYWKITLFSLIAHIFVLLFTFGLPELIRPAPRILYPTIRVDLVGLPEKRPFELTPPAPEVPKEEVAKPKTEPLKEKKKEEPKPVVKPKPLSPEEKKLKSIVEETKKTPKKKEDEELEKAVSEVAKMKKEEEAVEKELYKGNIKAEGTAVTGPTGEGAHPYLTYVEQAILQAWKPPLKRAEREIKTTIAIYINGRGEIFKAIIETPSGNEEFDRSAEEAVKKASPLKSPPEGLATSLEDDGIKINFLPPKE